MITPNRLTYLRIVLAFLCPILLITQRTFAGDLWVMFLFTVASVTDWWDGYLARKHGLVTGTGKILDPIADKILILGLMLAFVSLGLYSFAWILFILIREISVTTTRLSRLKKGKVIPAEWAGKLKVGFQIASVSASLIYITYLDFNLSRPSSGITEFLNLFNYFCLVLANIFTITSGLLFYQRLPKT